MSETAEPVASEISHEDVRDKTRLMADRLGLKTRDVSNASGVSYSTLHAFLGGKYAGDNDKVAAKLQTWIDSRGAATRTREALPAQLNFVETPTSEHFLTTLEQAQYIPDLVVISGGAGVGKTTSCEQYRRAHPNVWVLTAEPAMSSTMSMLEGLGELLGVDNGWLARRSAAIVRRIVGTGGLIIVDEAQHLSAAALDQLRTLHDKAQIGLALVGNETVYGRIDGGSRRPEYAQIFSRVGMRASRPRPLVKDITALLDHAGIEGGEERNYLTAVARKPGALRVMMKTLRVAHMLARGGDEGEPEPIGLKHLQAAWSRLSNSGQLAVGVGE